MNYYNFNQFANFINSQSDNKRVYRSGYSSQFYLLPLFFLSLHPGISRRQIHTSPKGDEVSVKMAEDTVLFLKPIDEQTKMSMDMFRRTLSVSYYYNNSISISKIKTTLYEQMKGFYLEKKS
jgi:hypothetical protein